MLHMIELRYPLQQRDELLQYFQERGVTHHEAGVVLKGAWVATKDRVAYALVESRDAEQFEKSCRPLEQLGEVSTRQVIDAEQV